MPLYCTIHALQLSITSAFVVASKTVTIATKYNYIVEPVYEFTTDVF